MLIGRQAELVQVRAALAAGLNLLLEGPVGVGKTHLVLEAIKDLGRPSWRVDGDDRFTEQKMAGWFDPAAVMRDGYRHENFIPGPLHHAMTQGGILFINELNRLPESVQNLLLPALDERLIQVPMFGSVQAAEGFQVVATMNPREFVATSELSEALRDRFELLFIQYQTTEEEAEIVRLNVDGQDLPDGFSPSDLEDLIGRAIDLIRLTRSDTAFRRGASVRAAISLVRIALALLASDSLSRDEAFDCAARMALASRIEPAEEINLNALDTLDAWLEEVKKKAPEPDAPELTRPRPRLRRPWSRPKRSPNHTPNKVTQEAAKISLKDLCQLADVAEDEDDAGFLLATRYHRVLQKFPHRRDLRIALDREVTEAVIRRARQIIESTDTFKHTVIEPYSEPGRGELLLEESLDEWVTKPHPTPQDLKVALRVERDLDIALMLDTSLSMEGRKLALSAVTAAVLACKSAHQRYNITLFQSSARTIKRLSEPLALRPMVTRIFEQTHFGYTNLEAALDTAARDFARGTRRGRRVGIIITDGCITEGGNPLPLAARFDALHVIMTEDPNMDRDLCHALANAGRGRLFALKHFDTLPALFCQILRVINR